MLIDTITITVKAGDGGNGAVHFRRNAQTAKGGPDGGNGGNGGNVYFQGVDDMLGLAQFRFKKKILAENGVNGGRQKLFGRNGKDLFVPLPVGTLVTDTTTQQQWEIQNTTDKILIAQGGKGGRGNDEFKSATIQTPYYAEKGGLGEEKTLHLELKLIADIGFIGLPNAGKSSLLKALTNANPKIGNYPFTTLEPNLGVIPEENIVLADIPGIIEGAHTGKGLGTTFLRHVEKTKFLVHCIDSTSENIEKDYATIRNELSTYSKELDAKPEIILLTKIDLLSQEQLQSVEKNMKKKHTEVLTVSIYNEKLLEQLKEQLSAHIAHV